METVIELGQLLEQKRAEYKKKFDGYPLKKLADGSEAKAIPANDLEGLRTLRNEINDIGAKFDAAREEEQFAIKNAFDLDRHTKAAHQHPSGDPAAAKQEQKSVGQMFVESKAFKGGILDFKNREIDLDVEYKTTMTTSAGWAPESVREGRVVQSAQRQPQIIDLIPKIRISQPLTKYMRETTFTNNSGTLAEGGTYGEAALALTEITEAVRKIGVFLPVTDEQLEDVEGIRDYIDTRLILMIDQKVDDQIMNGSGVAPNFTGFLNVSGIQTQALGTDPHFDAFLKAFTKVRTAGSTALGSAMPTALFLTPNNWTAVRLSKTADGIYILGSVAEAMATERVWGVRVYETTVLTDGTGFTGDFLGYSAYRPLRGITLKITDSDQDDFIKGKQKIRADVRGALDVYRNTAFCQLTGL